jgi:hypothetical protein
MTLKSLGTQILPSGREISCLFLQSWMKITPSWSDKHVEREANDDNDTNLVDHKATYEKAKTQ